MAERNLDHVGLPIPEDCKVIHVFADGELFDEFVAVGLVPLHDDRMPTGFSRLPDFSVPCFIGYAPGEDFQNPKGPDIVARLRAARSGETHSDIHSDKKAPFGPNQGPDSGPR